MVGKSFDELTIIDNFMFSKVMKNKELCRQFLEMVMGVKIKEITFPEYERTIDIRYDAKSIRLDVILEDEEHTVYNLEMQATSRDYLSKRTRYYQDLIDLDLLEKGQSYGELNRSIIIFVCTFDPFGKGRHIYSFENRCKEDLSLVLGDETEKIFINTTGRMDDIEEEFQNLMDFFNGMAPKGTFANALQAEVSKVKKSQEWRREYMTLQILLDDARREERKIGREEGREQGREEGRKEGREEGRQEGREEGADKHLIEQVCKKLARKMSVEKIADNLEEDIGKIKGIVEVAEEFAPQYDVEQIYKKMHVKS